MLNVVIDVKGKKASGRTTLISALIKFLESKGAEVNETAEHSISVVMKDAEALHENTNQMQAETDSTPQSVLKDAYQIVHGDREQTYGDAGKNFRTIAAYWNTHILAAKSIEARLTEEDVCGMMILLKQARLANSPGHRDSLVDIVGYTELNDIIQQQKIKAS